MQLVPYLQFVYFLAGRALGGGICYNYYSFKTVKLIFIRAT